MQPHEIRHAPKTVHPGIRVGRSAIGGEVVLDVGASARGYFCTIDLVREAEVIVLDDIGTFPSELFNATQLVASAGAILEIEDVGVRIR